MISQQYVDGLELRIRELTAKVAEQQGDIAALDRLLLRSKMMVLSLCGATKEQLDEALTAPIPDWAVPAQLNVNRSSK